MNEAKVDASHEIGAGSRFAFGANWARFLTVLDEDRIKGAESALRDMLAVDSLSGLRFLDIGSGSGLSSLAARRLGATVHSFDFDPQSVACTRELKRRYFLDDEAWRIEQGSVLDRKYLDSLGAFDIVYSWGVLHHTGAMWVALEHAVSLVAPKDGRLFIALYNDQGWKSHAWWFIKCLYNRLPQLLKRPYVACVSLVTHVLVIIKYTIKLRPMTAIAALLSDRRERGMSARHDAVDWIGGFPFEFSRFDVLVDYFEARGFSLSNSRINSSQGCNELVLKRTGAPAACAE